MRAILGVERGVRSRCPYTALLTKRKLDMKRNHEAKNARYLNARKAGNGFSPRSSASERRTREIGFTFLKTERGKAQTAAYTTLLIFNASTKAAGRTCSPTTENTQSDHQPVVPEVIKPQSTFDFHW